MAKKKWVLPKCSKIKLVPEESVITGCKTKHGAGQGFPNNCPPGSQCQTLAS